MRHKARFELVRVSPPRPFPESGRPRPCGARDAGTSARPAWRGGDKPLATLRHKDLYVRQSRALAAGAGGLGVAGGGLSVPRVGLGELRAGGPRQTSACSSATAPTTASLQSRTRASRW